MQSKHMIMSGTAILLLCFTILTANAKSLGTVLYFKDGKEEVGYTKYKLDYLTIETSENKSTKYEVTENSNALVTSKGIITSYTFKTPNPQNPDGLMLIPVRESFLITNVDNQETSLKNTNPHQDIYTIPPTFVETSSSTAILNLTIDLLDLIISY